MTASRKYFLKKSVNQRRTDDDPAEIALSLAPDLDSMEYRSVFRAGPVIAVDDRPRELDPPTDEASLPPYPISTRGIVLIGCTLFCFGFWTSLLTVLVG